MKQLLVPETETILEYQIYKNLRTHERILMRSFPAYMLSLSRDNFDKVLEKFKERGLGEEKYEDLKYILQKHKREEVSISEKAEYGLPVPVLAHSKNKNKVLSKICLTHHRKWV